MSRTCPAADCSGSAVTLVMRMEERNQNALPWNFSNDQKHDISPSIRSSSSDYHSMLFWRQVQELSSACCVKLPPRSPVLPRYELNAAAMHWADLHQILNSIRSECITTTPIGGCQYLCVPVSGPRFLAASTGMGLQSPGYHRAIP